MPESLLAACAARGHMQVGTRAATGALRGCDELVWQDDSTSAAGVYQVKEGQKG